MDKRTFDRTFDLWAIAGIFVAYAVTIRLAMGLDFAGCVLSGIANTVPVVLCGVAVRRVVVRRLAGRSAAMQLVAHLLLCAAFVVVSYGMLIVLLGLFSGLGPDGFVVRPFKASAAAWQSLENVTTYALIATVSYLQAARQAPMRPFPEAVEARAAAVEAAPVPFAASGEAPPDEDAAAQLPAGMPADAPEPEAATRVDAAVSRYFVRIGEELRPLDIDSVVSIAGADDYAEVRTLSGTHLVRVTLADFSKSLDPTKYARVHRSWIVNTHRIARAEPAGGGRLLLHMETGQTISTGRDGARLLRNRVL